MLNVSWIYIPYALPKARETYSPLQTKSSRLAFMLEDRKGGLVDMATTLNDTPEPQGVSLTQKTMKPKPHHKRWNPKPLEPSTLNS